MNSRTHLPKLWEIPKVDLNTPKLYKVTVYLATPYFSTDREVVKRRVEICNRVARQLVGMGIPAFSPCTYTAQWQGEDLAGDLEPANGWYDLDIAFLKGCGTMIILMLPGVESSKGVALEIKAAQENKIDLYRLEPDDIIVP